MPNTPIGRYYFGKLTVWIQKNKLWLFVLKAVIMSSEKERTPLVT
jgi:hypothetical protein